MFPLAGQSAGPNGLTLFEGTHGPWQNKFDLFFNVFFSFKIYIFFQGQRRSLQLVGYKAELAFPKRITLQRHLFLSRYSVQPWV